MTDVPDDVICDIVVCANDTALFYNCDPVSDLSEQLELAPELEFGLQFTLGCDTGAVSAWF